MIHAVKNEAEKLLLKLHASEIDSPAFMTELLETQLFMPIYEKPNSAGIQTTDKATPLTLTAESGEKVLILFSSPESAKSFVQEHEGYGGGLLAEFKWILEKVGTGIAISINPDSELGIDLEAGMIEQMTGY
jgi:hypothetical protein